MNNKTIRFGNLALVAVVSAFTCGANGDNFPSIEGVTLDPPESAKRISINYTLKNGPAIVTVDITTNGVSIGAKHVRTLSGAANKVVETGTHTVLWNAANDWPGNTNDQVRAVVTAWSTNTPPDYMVVNLAANKDVRWYTCEDALPGGVTNLAYRQSLLVLRKIYAAGVPWTMGTTAELGRYSTTANSGERAEVAHTVTLDHDYYMAIFEFTQGQWAMVTDGWRPAAFKNEQDWICRPIESVNYYQLMENTNGTANASYTYPSQSLAPAPKSFLGLLRYKTGVAFILPGEAEWEYAARAGHLEGTWGDGSQIVAKDADANLNKIARYARHDGMLFVDGAWVQPVATALPRTTDGGTGFVGSYPANDYGLYDMHGNVWETCLDWYLKDLTPNTTGNPAYVTSGTKRVIHGGSWGNLAQDCRASTRRAYATNTSGWQNGFRVVVPMSLWRPDDEADPE